LQSKKQRILRHTAGYTNVKKKLRHPVEWAARFQHLGAYSRNREGHDDRTKEKQESALTDCKRKSRTSFDVLWTLSASRMLSTHL
jgi:hypothetical protein